VADSGPEIVQISDPSIVFPFEPLDTCFNVPPFTVPRRCERLFPYSLYFNNDFVHSLISVQCLVDIFAKVHNFYSAK
jgi:hypothetical protein